MVAASTRSLGRFGRRFFSLLARRGAASVMGDAVPEDFLCPITHEPMVDPVVASDGMTYERQASRYFELGD
eukprot:4089594-Prymnesium_polylepis.1